MEITIKINGRMVSVEVSGEVVECYEQGKHKTENLYHERRRHWDEREFDEYIVATEGLLPCQTTPEDIVCQRETLAQLLSILDSCTAVQRERFLLYAIYEYTYDEIGAMYSCSKYAVRDSIEAVRKIFKKYLQIDPTNGL